MDNTKIEWTATYMPDGTVIPGKTFNPWWGCQKVSDGCRFCYAETLDNRWMGGHWGPGSDRKPMSEKYWAQPLKWNAAARQLGKPAKVFCASMADVFEDHPQVINWRRKLFGLIEKTPFLIWQLLTKRPENIVPFVPIRWLEDFPGNIWIGTSVENQAAADKRIPELLEIPVSVRFLSCEPLLGRVDLTEYAGLTEKNAWNEQRSKIADWGYDTWSGGFIGPGHGDPTYDPRSGIHWLIVGGESGHNARPMHPDWAVLLRDQCGHYNIPLFFKQWGEYLPACQASDEQKINASPRQIKLPSPHNPAKWNTYYRLGKKEAGRLLNGIIYNEFPTTNHLL